MSSWIDRHTATGASGPASRVASAIAAVALLIGLFAAGTSPASAATGSVYDGKSPYYNNCVNGSSPIKTADVYDTGTGSIVVATVQVMYSPRCGTNWVRTYVPYSGSPGNCIYSYKYIQRPAQGNLTGFTESEPDRDCDAGIQGWTYSAMVYAPGNTRIVVWGQFDVSWNSPSFGKWYLD